MDQDEYGVCLCCAYVLFLFCKQAWQRLASIRETMFLRHVGHFKGSFVNTVLSLSCDPPAHGCWDAAVSPETACRTPAQWERQCLKSIGARFHLHLESLSLGDFRRNVGVQNGLACFGSIHQTTDEQTSALTNRVSESRARGQSHHLETIKASAQAFSRLGAPCRCETRVHCQPAAKARSMRCWPWSMAECIHENTPDKQRTVSLPAIKMSLSRTSVMVKHTSLRLGPSYH